MQSFRSVRSHAVLLPNDDVDTDQIIPARFLTTTSRHALGQHVFADWRYDASGAPRPEFVLNRPASAGARILVAGRNFGCGSSREHAPWALMDWGFQVVVASSFADIFRTNAQKNGLLTAVLDEAALAALQAHLQANPQAEVQVSLAEQTVSTGGAWSASFPIDAFAKRCLMEGVDELDLLLSQLPDIERHEARPCAR